MLPLFTGKTDKTGTRNDESAEVWFPGIGSHPLARIRLFCFPYAGGGAAVYRPWSKKLPKELHVIPVELPGRGGRLRETSFLRFPGLIDALAAVISPLIEGEYAFFGHSMGALIAFELARELRRRGCDPPRRLLLSGRRAPQIPDTDPLTYNLPEPEFISELRRLNGTPSEVFAHEELMQFLLPVLRADFELIQTYEYKKESPLTCPFTLYGGLQDVDVPRASLAAWREQTSAGCSLHMLAGDHFFLRSAEWDLLRLLSEVALRGCSP